MAISAPCKGGCACGAIRYESSAEPLFMFRCRCRDCQRATGGPFAANVWFPAAAFTFTTGEPTYYVVQSYRGNTVSHGFCSACGSPIGMKSDAIPDHMGVRAASLDDPSGLEPKGEVWATNAYPWDAPDPGLPQLKAQPTEEDIEAFFASLS